jgi:hypothetical protein
LRFAGGSGTIVASLRVDLEIGKPLRAADVPTPALRRIDMRFPNVLTPSRRAVRIGVLALVLALHPGSIASAQTCAPTPALTSGVPVLATSDPAPFALTAVSNRWSGVAVRSEDPADWNFESFDVATPFPICFAGGLAVSNGPGIDFFVTDWRFRAPQTDYVRAATAGLTGTAARVEFEQAAYEYQANRPFDQIPVGATDVLTVRETELVAGVRYIFEIWPSAGLSGLKCYLFAPVTSGTGCVAKVDNVVELGLVDGGGNLFYYTPTVSGYFAIVVTNEQGSAGDFQICVKHCPFFANTMVDGVPVINVMLDAWPGFTPTAPTWGVVGERGEPGYFYNWDVAPGFRAVNGPYMTCSDSVLASQDNGVLTKVIAGDFRSNPLRFYTAHASLAGQPKTNAEGYFEWEDGIDSLVVNDPPTAVNPPAHNVLDAWSVRLVAGGTYDFQLVPDGGATAAYRMLVFSNPNPGTEYWGNREDAVVDSPGPAGFAPAATGLYGLVVVNDNGGTGGYSVSVTSTLVGVDPAEAGPGINRIRGVAPNPSFGRADVDFDLARAGRAGLRVTDVLGRTVAVVPATALAAGPNRIAWNGRTSQGTKPPAGVYFVTLELDDRAMDRAKLIRLR